MRSILEKWQRQEKESRCSGHRPLRSLPAGMSDNQVVEIVIDDFFFTPSNLEYEVDGGYCTKPCQCDVSSMCVSDICVPDS